MSKWSEAREGKYAHEVETDGSGKTTEIANEFLGLGSFRSQKKLFRVEGLKVTMPLVPNESAEVPNKGA